MPTDSEKKRYTPAGQAMSNVIKDFRETYRMQRDLKKGLYGSVREGMSAARSTWDLEKTPLRQERAMGILPKREKETAPPETAPKATPRTSDTRAVPVPQQGETQPVSVQDLKKRFPEAM